MIKMLLSCFVLNLSLFAHGIFYKVLDGALTINITAPNNLAISDAKVVIYAPEGSLPYTKGITDVNGNFSFLPDTQGNWKVVLNIPSDHGNHKKEFSIVVDEKLKMKNYEKQPYERYFAILASLGLIFGIFGLYTMYLRKKDMNH
jgi:nickel transport protein